MSVVVFHAGITIRGNAILPGGFLGVDIFFVISGYLISSIILAGLKQNNFSIAEFYERRARRILPVLLVVLLATLPFAWLLLYRREMIEFGDSILGTLFFYSNHVFIVDDYWSLNAKLKPLLHTWSLAVEEQFYLVMPWILILLYRYARKKMLLVIGALIIASLLFAETVNDTSPNHSFYLLPSRMWELMAGASLAILQQRRGIPDLGRYAKLLPATGVILILGSLVLFTEATRHPSVFTLIPIVGTMLIIRYANAADPLTRLLRTPPFVGIGKISYGLYLWHFPIFVFAQMAMPTTWQNYNYLLILFAVLISSLTYFAVEQPFRNKNKIALKSVFLPGLLVAYSLFSVFAYMINKQEGFKGRFDAQFPHFVENGIEYENVLLQQQSWSLVNSEQSTFEKGHAALKILLIGTSHAKDLFNSFELNSERYPEFDFGYMPYRCRFKISNVYGSAEYKNADYLVTDSPCVAKFIGRFKRDGKKVVLVTEHIKFKTEAIDAGDPRSRYLRGGIQTGGLTLVDQALVRSSKIDKAELERLAFQGSSFYKTKKITMPVQGSGFIDIGPVQCNEARSACLMLTSKGKKIHFDAAHWTLEGAKYFGEKIADQNLLMNAMQ